VVAPPEKGAQTWVLNTGFIDFSAVF
jgi:hypothetical protein